MMKKIKKIYVRACAFTISVLSLIIFKLFWGLKIFGKENIPKEGPFVIIANHQHLLDPTFIGAAMPTRQIFFMAKAEIFKLKIGSLFFRSLGAYPINRGKADKTAIKTTLGHLRNKDIICLFPEGTRYKDGELGEAKTGVVKLMAMAKVKIVPAYINLNNWRRPLELKFGQPFMIDFGDARPSKEELKEKSAEMMDKIRVLR